MASRYYDTEKCFRRYETCIVQAVISYPQEVRFKPENRSIATDTARCSDALSSWRVYKWKAEIDPDTVKTVVRDLCVWNSCGFVCIGPREALRRLRETQGKRDVVEIDHIAELVEVLAPVEEVRASGRIEKMSLEEFQTLDVEEAVKLIDEGQHEGPYLLPFSEDNMTRVRRAIGERINAVAVVNKSNQIQIF